MLKLEKINQFYGQSHTLWDIDLHIERGDWLCLMGRNGVGKTTLIQTIMGLVPAKSGHISLDGVDVTRHGTEKRVVAGMGYVPQGREIFSQLTVRENMQAALLCRTDKSQKIPDKIFELFPILKDFLHRKGGDLSGGQQQQLAIARALCTDPKILILDEPTEGIQPNVIQDIGKAIRQLNEEDGMTILLVEQKLPFARKFSKDYLILDKGRTVAGGSITTLDDVTVDQYLSV